MIANLQHFLPGEIVSYFANNRFARRNGWVHRGSNPGAMEMEYTFNIEPNERCIVLAQIPHGTMKFDHDCHSATYLLVRGQVVIYYEHWTSQESIWGN